MGSRELDFYPACHQQFALGRRGLFSGENYPSDFNPIFGKTINLKTASIAIVRNIFVMVTKMKKESIDILADAIKEYYGNYELEELCNQYNVEIEYLGVNPNHMKLAGLLVKAGDYNHKRLVEKLVPDLLERCNDRILNTTWESNAFDEQMLPHLKRLRYLLNKDKAEDTSKVELGNQFFSSRSEVRNFLGRAKGPVTLIDSQIGATTLVCLDGIKHKIRLLTSSDHEAIEGGFLDKLKKFRQSGHEIEIRRHVMIHDRYIFYNGRCWIASCSLNEVGRLQMSVIESIDAKSSIAKILEQKWREAKVQVM